MKRTKAERQAAMAPKPPDAPKPPVNTEQLTHHLKSDGTIVELTEDEKKKLTEEEPK
jgi:hypothetical protein